MLILRKDLKNKAPRVIYEVRLWRNVLTLNFKVRSKDRIGDGFKGSYKFDLKKLAGEIVELDLIQSDVPNKIVVRPMFKQGGLKTPNPFQLLGPDDLRIARLAVDENSDWVLQLAHPSEEIEGFKNLVRESGQTQTGQFVQASPFFKKAFENSQIKNEMLANVDYGNSIAYLEAQIDALTRIILAQQNGTSDEEALAFIKKANENSVFSVKAIDKIYSELDHKENLRTRQKQYYKRKDSQKHKVP